MSNCFSPFQVCRIRVAKLDANGDAVAGASSGYTSDALIDATLGVENDEGDEIIKRNGCGDLCTNIKLDDHFKRATLSLNFCKLDAELIYLITGGSLFTSSGNTIGWKSPTTTEVNNGVSLELWSKAYTTSEQGKMLPGGTVNSYYHFVFPRFKGTLGEIPLTGDDTAVIPVDGFGIENAAMNIDGPYNDWGAAVAAGNGFLGSSFGWFLDTNLPTAQCAYITVPAQGS